MNAPADQDEIAITVHLHTILVRQTPEGPVDRIPLSLPYGSTVEDILKLLQIQMPADSLLLVVNGRMTDEAHVLQHSDQVNLMPALSGGSLVYG